MIICNQYEFIFLKTRKTAGSSIEIALSRFCGPGDIVTRDTEEDEKLRREEGGFGPHGHFKSLWQYTPRELWKRLKYGQMATRFRNHAGAEIARSLVSEEFWARSYKFTAERNPWSKAVSRYYWQLRRWNYRPRKSAFPPFDDYLEYLEQEKPHWLSCWSIYTIDGAVVVDDFIFHEDLAGSLERIARRIGTPSPIQLPARRAKQRQQASDPDYRPHFTDRSREIVARVCHREIAAFGYRFDEPGHVPDIDRIDWQRIGADAE